LRISMDPGRKGVVKAMNSQKVSRQKESRRNTGELKISRLKMSSLYANRLEMGMPQKGMHQISMFKMRMHKMSRPKMSRPKMMRLQKLISILCTLSILLSALMGTLLLTGCSGRGKPIQINVYSQLANYSGKLTGWFAQVLLEKFNAEMTIIPESDGTFDTKMESGNLGDIIVFGNTADNYSRAVAGGYLYDWNEDNLLQEEGPYICENMQAALKANQRLTEQIYRENGIDREPTIFGISSGVGTSEKDVSGVIYTWDIRWDLYQQLGAPRVKNLDDNYELLVKMKEINPLDDNGNPVYAFSMWPDWDGHMMMYAKCVVTTYWGLEGDFGVGLFDVETGKYYRPIDEESHYFDALRFLNKLYRADLIDPNSMTQTVQMAGEKTLNGGTLASVFNYAGSAVFNTKENQEKNRMMLPLVPEDARPMTYGMSVEGSGAIWAIGAKTEYPELCMQILNWLATPEGFLTYLYGPKAEYNEETGEYDPEGCWYIKDGYTYFTELGESAYLNRRQTQMPEKWGGGTFQDGGCEITCNTWDRNASNPLTSGETYNAENWRSRHEFPVCEAEKAWREFTGCRTPAEYILKRGNYVVNHSTGSFKYKKLPDEIRVIISQLDNCVTTNSWAAVYAETEEECEKILQKMVDEYKSYDPDDLVHKWYLEEAKLVYEYELQKRGLM
jgi:putative aldouronate transport system substrate-binding protein